MRSPRPTVSVCGRSCTRSSTPRPAAQHLVATPCGSTPAPTGARRVRRRRGGFGCSSAGRGGTSTEEPERCRRPASEPRIEADAVIEERAGSSGAVDASSPGHSGPAAAAGGGPDGGAHVHRSEWSGVPAEHVRDVHAAVLRAGAGGRDAGGSVRRTTTGGRRWTRCTSRSWWTGSGRTCVARWATRCSTSRRWSRSVGWLRICTRRCVGRSRGRCSGRWSPRPTTRCGGRRSMSRSTSRCCRCGLRRSGYVDPVTGEALPTLGGGARLPGRRRRRGRCTCCGSGSSYDLQGIVATEGDADRRVAYLTKYLAKGFA